MQTVSPPIVQPESSPGGSISQGPNVQDPYLSAPSDPDEDDFRSTGIRLTPSQGEGSNQHPTPDDSSPSSGLQIDGGSPRGIDSPVGNSDSAVVPTGSYRNYLSPGDLSTHTPPSDAPLTGGLGANLESRQESWERGLSTTAPASLNMFTSPSEAQLALHNALGSNQPQRQMAPLTADVGGSGLDVQGSLGPDSARARSPIVKVESYSRGDSPVRSSCPSVRRQSQSSAYLSPENADESSSESEDEGKDTGSDNSISRAHDGSWIPNAETGHVGVDPASRTDVYVPSPSDMETQRQIDDKNEGIRSWSVSVSAANSEAGDETLGVGSRPHHAGKRRRAISAGDPSRHQDYFNFKLRLNGSNIPGPGLLLYESSNEDFSEHESDIGSRSVSAMASVNQTGVDAATSENAALYGQQDAEREGPLPNRWFPHRDWQDLPQDSTPQIIRTQPPSSNAAISAFNERARDLETASRVATWGTERLSKSLDKMSIHDKNTGKERRPSLLANAANNLKRQLSHISITPHGDDLVSNEGTGSPHRKDSFPIPRKLSIGNIGKSHPRSPSLSTPSAVIAMTGQLAAIGGRGSVGATPSNGVSTRNTPRRSRQRSRSEIPKGSVPSLVELMTSHGGPPVANLAHSAKATGNNVTQMESDAARDAGADDDGDDDVDGDRGLVMEFPSISRLPVPTLEGFKAQVAQLNPRLGPCLTNRFANEQLRRYKELVECKSSHSRAASQNKCMAGKYCFAQGGDAVLLPPRTGPQDTDSVSPQFQIARYSEAGDEENDGVVSPAQFPNGVPLPPVKRLPAEFECSVCFKVRKFHKPSDWTKHVHEDVQPFTCTFADCTEPKSFKRKADWVRHESERHRKLEWWTCAIPNCQHTCYRKNNFVQHLVREHKLPEPGVKKLKDEEPQRELELERLWELVERCRHDTPRTPRDEPCRFCGNICSSWKKLTVHLAKHMEQIALPVLQLVQERDFPLNAGIDAAKGVHAIPDPTTNMDEPSYLGPHQGAVQNGSAMGLNGGHSEQAKSAASLHYPHMVAMQEGVMSAEPEQMESYDMPRYPQFDVPRAPGSSVNQAGHSQSLAAQQNSVTYPPPFNAVPRPRASNQEMGLLQGAYEVSMSPPEMGLVYGSQAPFYLSPATGANFALSNPAAQAMPYDPPDAADYSKDAGASYM